MGKLSHLRAVITGGSGGIGRSIAEAYLRAGAAVWIVSRDQSEVAKIAAELASRGDIRGSACDVADEESMAKLVEEVGSTWDSIDVLVNGAGLYGPIGPLDVVSPAEWLDALRVNLFGTFLAMHDFAPLLRKSARATIINFVGGGEGAYPNFSSYVAAKGGIARLTETAAAELREAGIMVNAIAPGPVNTKFLDDLLAAGPEKAGSANYERALAQKASGGTSPERAAALALWLASEPARGLTGKILSAVWDAYEEFPKSLDAIMSSDVYTLRRVRPEGGAFGPGS